MADFPVGANTKPAIDNIDKLISSLRAAGKQAGLTEDEITKLVNAAKKAGTDGATGINKINSELSNLGGLAKSVGPAIAGVFALDKLKQFVGEVVNITSEFQKFEAVLTNTLGSNSAAKKVLNDIQKFASVTPFSVKELTESFVKLANQGFKPTTEELRKLGDLASSTGKQFDQLTEAIIDAQTGEFERLKEFGIRASKSGDQVKFTFKGVETQAKFTADSIRNYVLSLGELDGVSGSMAAISKTLGGQISNLGDSWDNFLKTLGDGNNGILSDTVSLLDKALKISTQLVSTYEQETAARSASAASKNLAIYNAQDEVEQAKTKQKIYEEILRLQIEIAKVDNYNRKGAEGKLDIKNTPKPDFTNYFGNKEKLAELNQTIALIANQRETAEKEKLQKEIAAANAEKEARLKKEKEANEELLRERRKFINELVNEKEADIQSGKVDPLVTDRAALKALNDELKAERKAEADAEFERQAAENERKLQQEKEFQERRKAIQQAAFDFGVELVNTIYTINIQNYQAELDSLQSQKDSEIRLAGDNAKAKEKINRDFASKERQLKRKAAEEQRNLSTFNVLVSTAESIVKTGANLGYPAAIPFQIFAALTGGLQLAAILNQKLPAFKDGIFDLNGPGSETSDSILARLSAHESVVPARKSRKFKDILKPIIEDENVGYNDLKAIIDRNIPNHLRGDLFIKMKQDTDPVMHEMRDLLREIKNKPTTGRGLDAKGLYDYVEQGGTVKKTYKQNWFW